MRTESRILVRGEPKVVRQAKLADIVKSLGSRRSQRLLGHDGPSGVVHDGARLNCRN